MDICHLFPSISVDFIGIRHIQTFNLKIRGNGGHFFICLPIFLLRDPALTWMNFETVFSEIDPF